MDYNNLKKLAVNYLKARHGFLTKSAELEDLSGNDNIIGRIGELVALQFLRQRGREVVKTGRKNEKGYDLLTSDEKKISVKLITSENNSGRTTKIGDPWDELILISLREEYKVECIGHLTAGEYKMAREEGFFKATNFIADRRMLSDNGLISKFGRLYKKEEVIGYL